MKNDRKFESCCHRINKNNITTANFSPFRWEYLRNSSNVILDIHYSFFYKYGSLRKTNVWTFATSVDMHSYLINTVGTTSAAVPGWHFHGRQVAPTPTILKTNAFWKNHTIYSTFPVYITCVVAGYRRSWVRFSSPAPFFRWDWSWNRFHGHSLPSVNSKRTVVSYWRNNVHRILVNRLVGLSLPMKKCG